MIFLLQEVVTEVATDETAFQMIVAGLMIIVSAIVIFGRAIATPFKLFWEQLKRGGSKVKAGFKKMRGGESIGEHKEG